MIRIWLGFIFLILGALLTLFATISQMIVACTITGVFIFNLVFIVHWTAWFYLGIAPMIIGYFLLRG